MIHKERSGNIITPKQPIVRIWLIKTTPNWPVDRSTLEMVPKICCPGTQVEATRPIIPAAALDQYRQPSVL